MKKPLYIQTIRESWEIVWEHKILWIFGLFATFLGQAGIGDLIHKILMLGFKNPIYLDTFFVPKGFVELFILTTGLPLSISKWFALIWLFVILAGLLFFFIFVAVISQGAIINSIAQKVRGKKVPDFGTAWHKGVNHSGRLFFINVLKKSLILLVTSFVTLSLLIMYSSANIFTFSSFVVTLVLALISGMLISFLAIYAAGYVVVEEYSFVESIVAAWRLFTHHPLVSIEVGLIIMILNFAVMLLGFLAIFFFFLIPLAVFWFLSILTGVIALKMVGIIFGFVITLFIVMTLGSVFTAFATSVWTDLFMRMHKEGVKSKLVHFIDKLKS
ncbi:MAG: hypothetical protein L3J07_03715 [Candidatus Magasanikbacteria bacterium]|nr:hypothetical protein [Candidatus Magasanikbacteria bacterium]